MSSTRKKLLNNPVVVNIGCGCRRPKLSSVFNRKPPSNNSIFRRRQSNQSSSSSWERGPRSRDDEEDSTATISPAYIPMQGSEARREKEKGRRISESVAVEKESVDPYLDFRHSMLQMILEQEIYGREDLRELLNCFLSLNSPHHHEIIIRAFMEIWNGVCSSSSSSSSSSSREGQWGKKSREFRRRGT